MDKSVDFSEPLPTSSVLLFLGGLILGIAISALMIVQYKSIFLDEVEFATYSSFALVGISIVLLMVLLLYEVFMRNVKRDFKPSEIHLRLSKYILYFVGLSLLLGPLIIGPTMSRYMKSEGYERCRDTPSQTGLTGSLFPAWAKPSVGCEVWELSDKERNALKLAQ